jgi:hypothetical protein
MLVGFLWLGRGASLHGSAFFLNALGSLGCGEGDTLSLPLAPSLSIERFGVVVLCVAVEASNMARHAETLVRANGMEDRIIVVNKICGCRPERENTRVVSPLFLVWGVPG